MAQQLNIDIVARDKSQQALNKVQSNLSKVKGAVFNLRNAFIGLGAGLVIKSIVNTGIQIENLGVQLKALFGSAQAGQKALDQVKKFAETTPFELENIQQGVTALATVTKSAEEAGVSFDELLKITGNTAVQLGGDFALASQQIQRAFSAGIGSADLFRDRAVTAMAGFQAGAKYSVNDTIKTMAKAFGTGGEFGNLTEELSRTLSGTISNLQDALFRFRESIASGFFYQLKKQLGDLKVFITDNEESIRKFGVEIGENVAVGIVKLSNGIKTLAKNFKELELAMGTILVVLGGFTKILVGGALIIDDYNRRLKKLLSLGKTVREEIDLNAMFDDFGFPEFKKQTELILSPIHEFEHELSVKVPSALDKVINKLKELNDKALLDMQIRMNNIHQTIAEGISRGITKLSETLARAVVYGDSLITSFKELARQILVNVLSALIEQVALMGLQKLLNLDINKQEAEKDNLIRKQNTNLKRQIALQAILMAMGGGGGGGSSMKFFANGGTVSKGQPIVVGERGAELFIPNSTGQITQSARGTSAGQPVSVNFNINTLDARGFDELLVRNRGTITQIINSAVNERGSKNLI
jgi:hypothetical protein